MHIASNHWAKSNNTHAYIDCRDTEWLYAFEDREVLVRHENDTFGTVPTVMLTATENGWMRFLEKKGGRDATCELVQECEGYG